MEYYSNVLKLTKEEHEFLLDEHSKYFKESDLND